MTEKTKIIAGMEIQEDVLKLRIEKEQLEQENNKLLDVINNQDVKIADLESENAELRNNGFTVSAMTEQQLKVAIKKGEQLEKENAELKETIADIEKNFRICESNADTYYDLLTKATEILIASAATS